MKNRIATSPDIYIINDKLMATPLPSRGDKIKEFIIYPIIQVRNTKRDRLYYIALTPYCKYKILIPSDHISKADYILKRMWNNHTLDMEVTCIGNKKYTSYYINGHTAYHIFNEINDYYYTFICTDNKGDIKIYDKCMVINQDDNITIKANIKIDVMSCCNAHECNIELPIIVLGYDELELYN